SKSYVWLRSCVPLELINQHHERRQEGGIPALFGGLDVDAEVETLDALLTDCTDVNALFGPRQCPGSFIRGWTGLHVLMHLRIEPVWHPWSVGAIYQQGTLWSDAMHRMISQGADPHATDWQGNTPTYLALRSLYTFHLWQNAVFRQAYIVEDFVRKELEV